MERSAKRGSIRHHIRIDCSAAAAWRVVGKPEILHHWFPGILACVVDGNSRTITVGTGMQMPETILTNDALQMRFQYRISTPIFKEHLASVDVISLSDSECLVTYCTDAEPASMALMISGGTLGALGELKRQCEAGVGPAIDAAEAIEGAR